MRSFGRYSWFAFSIVMSCTAEQWEVGGAAGYGLYRNANFASPAGNGDVGFKSGSAFSAVGGQNLYSHIGGEFRYLFQTDQSRISFGAQQAVLGAQSHAFHYDFLFHATPRRSPVRPFFAVGAGAKLYRGTGIGLEQPLQNIAVLRQAREIKPLISIGGGVKFRLGEHAQFRIDFRDYATPFPQKIIIPRPGTAIRGWLHDFVPLAGLSLTL